MHIKSINSTGRPTVAIESSRMAGLDTLRGLAILAVVAFHVCLAFPPTGFLRSLASLGYNGVQLFFIVSAITMCHMWEQRRGEPAPVRSFFIRRLCRIAPPFWFAIAFYVTWNEFVFDGANAADRFDLLATATFVHGFFPSTINRVVPGGWSIAAEVFFYVLFPLLTLRLATARLRIFWALLTYFVCTASASAIWSRYGPDLDHFLYYSLLTQLPVFMVGMVVYSLRVRRESVSPFLIVAVICIWMGIAEAYKALGLPGRPGLWMEVGVLAILAGFVVGRFDSRFLAFIGRFSYSAYLFHFAVIDVLVLLVSNDSRHGTASFVLAFIATCVLTGLIAWISSKSIEAWSMSMGRALIRRMDAPCVAVQA